MDQGLSSKMNTMRKYLKFSFLLTVMVFLLSTASPGQQVEEISVLAGKPTAVVQPTMWGVFFEDINFAADGGLYAELVKNRSFEFAAPMMGWKIQQQNVANGTVLVINRLAEDSS